MARRKYKNKLADGGYLALANGWTMTLGGAHLIIRGGDTVIQLNYKDALHFQANLQEAIDQLYEEVE